MRSLWPQAAGLADPIWALSCSLGPWASSSAGLGTPISSEEAVDRRGLGPGLLAPEPFSLSTTLGVQLLPMATWPSHCTEASFTLSSSKKALCLSSEGPSSRTRTCWTSATRDTVLRPETGDLLAGTQFLTWELSLCPGVEGTGQG